jgi:hypothetical protein
MGTPELHWSHVWDNRRTARRMLKKAGQQGRSERRGEAYSVRYVEPLSEARTPLADFFSVLLVDQRRDLDRFLNQAIARKRL